MTMQIFCSLYIITWTYSHIQEETFAFHKTSLEKTGVTEIDNYHKYSDH